MDGMSFRQDGMPSLQVSRWGDVGRSAVSVSECSLDLDDVSWSGLIAELSEDPCGLWRTELEGVAVGRISSS